MAKRQHENEGAPRGRNPASGEEGFALALVVLALVGMTTMAMAGYLRSNTDYKINQNHSAALRAFNISDDARSQYLGRGKLRSDTTTYSYAQGAADVWSEMLIAVDDSSTLYRLVSSSQHNSPEGGTASRRTSSIVIHKAAGFAVNAALTAPAGLLKNGTAGTLEGADGSVAGDCPVAASEDVAGLQTPEGLFTDNGSTTFRDDGVVVGGGGKGKGSGGIGGHPAIDSTRNTNEIIDDVGINWQGMLDGSFAEADYVYSQDGFPNFSTDVEPDEWPLIHMDASTFSLDNSYNGRGTLVVSGDVTFNGDFMWDGLILIGGQLSSNGGQIIQGAIIAGLNIQLGQAVGPVDLGNGTWNYQYNSCNVLNALKGVGWPVEEPHTWVEIF
ncbi:MAG: hypothetical protein R3195_05725 [Gemmatimonadota bacterium]|nr:hypothetical protein [Gemmatimonadota bacterium]